MADTVVEQVAERLDIPPSEARLVLNALSKLIHQQAEQEGRVRVPGIGIFAQATDDAPLAFTPDAALERVVNHRYAGMASAAAPPVADAPGAASEAAAGGPSVAAASSDATDDAAPSAENTSAEETMEQDAPEQDAPEQDAPADGPDAMAAETSGYVAPATPPASPDTAEAEAEGATDTTPSVRVEDKDSAATPEAEDKEQAVSASASGDAPPASDPTDATGGHADGDERTQPAAEEATPNSAPALIGLVLALLLAAGAAWWLLTDDPAAPPETPDTAVVEPEPADETDQPAPDPAPPADGADEAIEEVAPTAEPNALAEGVDPSALPSGAGTIDPALGGFALVVASVPSAEDAEAIEANYRDAIANDPLPTALLVSQTGDVTRYRVGIGQFATQDEALAVRDARSEVLPGDAWVLRLTPAMARN